MAVGRRKGLNRFAWNENPRGGRRSLLGGVSDLRNLERSASLGAVASEGDTPDQPSEEEGSPMSR